jgi:hypothetical protein
MCNRFVQHGKEVRPGQPATVLLRGPGGEFELPYAEAVFGGPARTESRQYWIRREGAQDVLIPGIERFGEKDKRSGQQNWAEVPEDSAMEGLLLPPPPGKEYRLLKVVTQPATPGQLASLGNDRVPVFPHVPAEAIILPAASASPAPEPAPRPPSQQLELLGD